MSSHSDNAPSPTDSEVEDHHTPEQSTLEEHRSVQAETLERERQRRLDSQNSPPGAQVEAFRRILLDRHSDDRHRSTDTPGRTANRSTSSAFTELSSLNATGDRLSMAGQSLTRVDNRWSLDPTIRDEMERKLVQQTEANSRKRLLEERLAPLQQHWKTQKRQSEASQRVREREEEEWTAKANEARKEAEERTFFERGVRHEELQRTTGSRGDGSMRMEMSPQILGRGTSSHSPNTATGSGSFALTSLADLETQSQSRLGPWRAQQQQKATEASARAIQAVEEVALANQQRQSEEFRGQFERRFKESRRMFEPVNPTAAMVSQSSGRGTASLDPSLGRNPNIEFKAALQLLERENQRRLRQARAETQVNEEGQDGRVMGTAGQRRQQEPAGNISQLRVEPNRGASTQDSSRDLGRNSGTANREGSDFGSAMFQQQRPIQSSQEVTHPPFDDTLMDIYSHRPNIQKPRKE